MPTMTAELDARELAEIDRANASERPVVVFVHGLWMLAGSWDPWREMFEARGYATIAPNWPDDPPTVEAARARPETFAGKSVDDITRHIAALVLRLDRKPAIIGHSVGGMITQRLVAHGLAAASVPIDPAPVRGVLPLPISALRGAWPVVGNPVNRGRAVMLTYEQFRYAFANAVPEPEARRLYETYPVPGSGIPLFQSALANVNPNTEARADADDPERGPMAFVSGDLDHIVTPSMTHAAYKRQRRNPSTTEIHDVPGRGHSLVFDSGWHDVAGIALDFVDRVSV